MIITLCVFPHRPVRNFLAGLNVHFETDQYFIETMDLLLNEESEKHLTPSNFLGLSPHHTLQKGI